MSKAITKPLDPGKPLKNLRHEEFCQLICIAGFWEKREDAYLQVFMKCKGKKNARKHASRLAHRDDVSSRVSYLRAEVYKQLGIDRGFLAEKRIEILGDSYSTPDNKLRALSDLEKSAMLQPADRLHIKSEAKIDHSGNVGINIDAAQLSGVLQAFLDKREAARQSAEGAEVENNKEKKNHDKRNPVPSMWC